MAMERSTARARPGRAAGVQRNHTAVAMRDSATGQSIGTDIVLAWRRSDEGVARIFASQDVREGVAALIEKRPPAWTGR